jgi:O-antigen ligase
LVSGAASLGRIDYRLINLGAVGEVRFVLLLAAGLFSAALALAHEHHASRPRALVCWLAACLFLHLLALISWLWSTGGDFANVQAYELILLCASLILCALAFGREPARGMSFLLWMFLAVGASTWIAMLVFSGGLTGDVAALGAGGIGTARLFGAAVLACVYFFIRRPSLWWVMPIPIFVGGIFLSGSRASVLALVLGGMALLARWRVVAAGRPPPRPGQVILILVATLAIVAVILLSNAGQAVVLKFVMSGFRDDLSTDGEPRELYLADRDIIFADAWSAFFGDAYGGLGLGTYVGPFGEQYPHNLFLNFAVDCGFVGGTGFILVVGWAMRRLWSSRSQLAVAALSMAMFFLIASLFAGSYYDARFLWVFLYLGLAHDLAARNTALVEDSA